MFCIDTCCRGEREAEVISVHLATRSHTARKEHFCRNCGEVIRPGERYVRQIWLVDGDFMSVASHSSLICEGVDA